MKRIGPAALNKLVPHIDSKHFSKEIFEQTGIFIIRDAIDQETLNGWSQAWKSLYSSELANTETINRFNHVSIDQDMPPILANIHKHPALLDIIEQAFGPDLALYNQRFVIKDQYRTGDVFIHSDYPYHFGWPNKASAFIALSHNNEENGSLFFYPGTHQLGYLADAGEINPEVLPAGWPVVSPTVAPGDVVLMNSLTWHGSHPFVSGSDRIFVDIIYQPADDPSGISLLRGNWQTEIFIDKEMKSKLFKRSRVSRMVEMQKKLDLLESASVKL